MKSNRKKFIIFILAFIVILGLYLNSNALFCLKMANFYKGKQQYPKAIRLYEKILRKNNVKRRLNSKELGQIYFDLGYLYSSLNLENVAINLYARGSKNAVDIDTSKYLCKNDFQKDKLLAIGLLESGEFILAVENFNKLWVIYISDDEYCGRIRKYIDIANSLIKQRVISSKEDFLYSIGNAYIQNQLFEDAREFFTQRILDYGMNPLEVLSYLQREYHDKIDLKEKIWGREIYITLENFEKMQIQLVNWVSTSKAQVNSHYIDDTVAFKGHHSEWLDVSYTRKRILGDFDYWIKPVNIPLCNTGLKLGIRFYLKKIKPSELGAGFNVIYSKQEISGCYNTNFKIDALDNWYECRIEDLYASANTIAKPRKWSMEKAFIDKIIVGIPGISDKFLIDEIELFLVDE